MIKIFNEKDKSIVTYTDNKGAVKLDLPEGEYKALVAKDSYKVVSDGTDPLMKVKVVSSGNLRNNVYLEKEANSQDSLKVNSDLINPFG